MKPEHETSLGIAPMLLAGVGSVLLGWWLLGAGLLALGIALAAVTLVARRWPPRCGQRRRR